MTRTDWKVSDMTVEFLLDIDLTSGIVPNVCGYSGSLDPFEISFRFRTKGKGSADNQHYSG